MTNDELIADLFRLCILYWQEVSPAQDTLVAFEEWRRFAESVQGLRDHELSERHVLIHREYLREALSKVTLRLASNQERSLQEGSS